MNEISLVGKVVKIEHPEDLVFYYPEFTVKNSVSLIDYGDNIIFTGLYNKRAQNILSSCKFIVTQGLYEVDLTNRKQKVEFVYSKWGREVPKNIMDSIDLYDDDEFDYCCKIYWISARWPYRPEHELSIYELYQASVSSIGDFIKKFLEVCESYPVNVVIQSFFTFMLRSRDVDEQNVSPAYKRLLKTFNNISGSKVKRAMASYIESPIENKQLRFIEFIYALRG